MEVGVSRRKIKKKRAGAAYEWRRKRDRPLQKNGNHVRGNESTGGVTKVFFRYRARLRSTL